MDLPRMVYREALLAKSVIEKYAHKTPLDYTATLSRITGASVYLKCENLQKTGSFKVRGALYKVYKVKDKAKGVVAVSAGNHAQGVAYAARCFGLKSVIVMPVGASISKVEATRGYGAEVVLYGSVFDEAEKKAREIAEERGYEMVHAFNDLDVIAGQGTIALEILDQLNGVETVIVPIGGGGLISGIASVLKQVKPSVKVIGVEPEAAPKMLESMKAGRPVWIKPKPTIADGLVVKKPSDLTFKLVSELVDDIVTVSEEEIAHAIYLLLERCKILAEGAGAVSVAALLSGKVQVKGRNTVAVVSGGNIDLTALYRVLMRGLCEAGRIVVLQGYVPDTPGTLARVTEVIAKHRGNIIDVLHERTDVKAPAWHAKVSVVIEVPSRKEAKAIVEELEKQGYHMTLEN